LHIMTSVLECTTVNAFLSDFGIPSFFNFTFCMYTAGDVFSFILLECSKRHVEFKDLSSLTADLSPRYKLQMYGRCSVYAVQFLLYL
jgi:hypothetical protein